MLITFLEATKFFESWVHVTGKSLEFIFSHCCSVDPVRVVYTFSCTEYHFIHLSSSLAHCHHGTSQHCLMNFTLLLMEEQFGWMWQITLMTKRLLSLILSRNMADLHIQKVLDWLNTYMVRQYIQQLSTDVLFSRFARQWKA